ncbi:hypothetical protein GUITHDRAFT_151000 [Guillardia theta CCMP2712]|uniref:Uncharacterized protein n=1 Tax=Guillardia theta (strain CCMP2712) TaxID=905079 RepID=L1JSI5_GUITC|nr:hypothetical protein GUITHDRAFT_151000 [Guillardia theta CCMP2712]EKX51150.1 hypothetical protein GUITHDRAFT_151000 [Guillardia theta CCMP2712]|eukprot:XP_005838130.1 hypothetical protein GUITHDRAFT_151000 [Guillardia theta CCMP2712]
MQLAILLLPVSPGHQVALALVFLQDFLVRMIQGKITIYPSVVIKKSFLARSILELSVAYIISQRVHCKE